ncbi:MAG: hypothetical protein QNK04_04810 [Myxococcota bacterium]|nr:hypothetical protein [Myxococcota bacterium]
MLGGVLDWTANRPGVSSALHLRAFRVLLLAHVAVQSWAWAIRPTPPPVTFPPVAVHAAAAILTLLCVGSLFGRGRLCCALAFPIVAGSVAWIFPMTANHNFLVLVLIGLCASFDLEDRAEEALLVQSLRWVAILIFFWAGVQKALHGMYFRGEFLTWMIAQGVERWADIFGWMLPDGEVARLRSLPRYMPGAGPYRVDSLLFLLSANSVWLGEMALAVGLVFRRTRELAALGAIVLVFLIQLAPREFMFALLYTNLLLLFVRGDWNRRLLPLFLGAYAYLLAVLLGAPGRFLLKAGGLL